MKKKNSKRMKIDWDMNDDVYFLEIAEVMMRAVTECDCLSHPVCLSVSFAFNIFWERIDCKGCANKRGQSISLHCSRRRKTLASTR